jgi:ABC-2 type transport system ATP-binding protein
MALIDVRDLERTFVVRRKVDGGRRRLRDEVRAVHDLTFSVEAGEMVGYIGPNGAGKSTTVKMLTGILS